MSQTSRGLLLQLLAPPSKVGGRPVLHRFLLASHALVAELVAELKLEGFL